jgi:hypothetical protein
MTKAKPERVPALTLPAFARKVGLHRTTLLRMEQKGIITKAPTLRGTQMRVYDEDLQKICEKEIQEYMESVPKAGSDLPLMVNPADLTRDAG